MKKNLYCLSLAAALAGCSSLKDRLDKVEDGVSNLETENLGFGRAVENGSAMSPIVFNVSADCRTISIDPTISIGTYDPIYGAGFTNYGNGYSLTKE